MKVVLVRPPFVRWQDGPPIGLAFLKDFLQRHGHEVRVIDFSLRVARACGCEYTRDFLLPDNHPARPFVAERLDAYCDEILAERPDVVGFSLMYCSLEIGLEMARKLKPHVRCIVGGPQAAYNEQDLLDTGLFDTVVSSYGEEGLLEALNGRTGIIPSTLTKGFDYRPDYSDTPLADYDGMLPIVTTRGCPQKCTFCTQNHPYYYHSIESVLDEYRRHENIQRVMFNDSNINVNHKRTAELFEAVAGLPGPKPPAHVFGMQVRPNFEDYVPQMAAAGVFEARLGIESGSVRERASMRKPKFDNDLVVACVRELTRHKITTWMQFIFCYPDQSEDDRTQTLALMRRCNEEADPQYIRHFWFRFVVHHGMEKYFAHEHGVRLTTLKTWENRAYATGDVERLAAHYEREVPENAQIYI